MPMLKGEPDHHDMMEPVHKTMTTRRIPLDLSAWTTNEAYLKPSNLVLDARSFGRPKGEPFETILDLPLGGQSDFRE